MGEESIIKFLIKAKRATYAGNGPEVKSSRPNSHDLEYLEGNLRYIDTYIGGQFFAGEEALWFDDKPFWAMNYCGRALSDEFDNQFLKKALLSVSEEMPFRGPKEFKEGDLLYKCDAKGDFWWCFGREEIYKDGELIYECIFHGGKIR